MKKLVMLLLAGFISSALAADGLMVMNAWVAEAPPTAKMNAGYMDIMNNTDKELVLTGVTSTALGMVMLHETVIEDGVSKMNHLDQVVIGAHQSVKFAPGGKHLMFNAPAKPLKAGDKVMRTLHCADGQKLEVAFTVRKQGDVMGGMKMDHPM